MYHIYMMKDIDGVEARKQLRELIDAVNHVVCYIRKDKELMQAIDEYCKDLPVNDSKDLNEKAYWFLHDLKEYPHCQCDGCSNKVIFAGLKKGYRTACCNSHAQIVAWPKNAETNLKKFGSKTPLQNKEIRAKINQHNLETYGTVNVVESEYFKKKRVETCRENLGVDYPMQSEEVREKSRASCKETYGVEYVLQNEEVKAKGRATSRRLYGVDNPMQNEEIKAKGRATLQKNYGVDAPAQCPEIRRKQQLRCEYKGMNFDSIYEIAYYIWLVDNNIEFIYEPGINIPYAYNEKQHYYMPDFIVEGKIIEIKGDHFFKEDGTMQNPFDHSQDELYEAKHQCMLANNVKIIKASEMTDILDYICSKYGKNYLKQFRRCAKKV